jgi:ribosomal protein S1
VQITPSVEALVHVSELTSGEEEAVDPEKLFKLNEKKDFRILEIDKEGRKIALTPESHTMIISPPLLVIGNPVAEPI